MNNLKKRVSEEREGYYLKTIPADKTKMINQISEGLLAHLKTIPQNGSVTFAVKPKGFRTYLSGAPSPTNSETFTKPAYPDSLILPVKASISDPYLGIKVNIQLVKDWGFDDKGNPTPILYSREKVSFLFENDGKITLYGNNPDDQIVYQYLQLLEDNRDTAINRCIVADGLDVPQVIPNDMFKFEELLPKDVVDRLIAKAKVRASKVVNVINEAFDAPKQRRLFLEFLFLNRKLNDNTDSYRNEIAHITTDRIFNFLHNQVEGKLERFEQVLASVEAKTWIETYNAFEQERAFSKGGSVTYIDAKGTINAVAQDNYFDGSFDPYRELFNWLMANPEAMQVQRKPTAVQFVESFVGIGTPVNNESSKQASMDGLSAAEKILTEIKAKALAEAKEPEEKASKSSDEDDQNTDDNGGTTPLNDLMGNKQPLPKSSGELKSTKK